MMNQNPFREGIKTHDYTSDHRRWGHDYSIDEFKRSGKWIEGSIFGFDIRKGDFLLFEQGGNLSRYKIKTLEGARSVDDMYFFTATFAPYTKRNPATDENPVNTR